MFKGLTEIWSICHHRANSTCDSEGGQLSSAPGHGLNLKCLKGILYFFLLCGSASLNCTTF